jgi:Zn-dependent peptidase ImmA (M78 family)
MGQWGVVAGPVRDERAYDVRRRYHERYADAELPVPVEAIAEDLLGLALCFSGLDVSGMLLPDRREIWVNETDVPGRRRFTVAHEIGHWICQALAGRPAAVYCRAEDVSESADRAIEREANVFAAELLMPEELVREEFPRCATRAELCLRFGVSAEAMGWRLYNLRLVDEKPQ